MHPGIRSRLSKTEAGTPVSQQALQWPREVLQLTFGVSKWGCLNWNAFCPALKERRAHQILVRCVCKGKTRLYLSKQHVVLSVIRNDDEFLSRLG